MKRDKFKILLVLLLAGSANAATLLSEGFEGSFPPSEWQNVPTNGPYTWQQHQGTYHPGGYDAHGGSYVAMFNSYTASDGNSARLITDTIDLTSYSSATLKFWMFHDDDYSGSNDSIVVEIKKRSGSSWPSDWTAIGTFKRYDSSGDAWHEHTIDLSDYTGDSIIIAFHAMSAYGNDLHIDDVSVETPADNDVGVTGIIQPDFPKVNQSASWGFIVKNFGNQAQSNFWVVFNTKKNTTKDSVQVSSLAAGATDTVYKSWTPSTSGYDTMFAWTNLSNDENHSNDTSDLAFYVLNQDEYLFEDFETGFPPNEWQNVALSGSYTWEWVTSTSHPSGYNPYSGSHLARYNSYSAGSGYEARLITDTIDLSSVSTAKLEFYMFHDDGYSDKPDSLIIEIKRRSGGSWPTDWTRIEGFARYNSSGDGWQKHTVDLSSYTGDSVIIAFKAKSGNGNDIYLDRIRLFKPPDNDVGVIEVIAKRNYRVGDGDTVWFVVKNFGAQSQSNFWVVFNSKKTTTKDSVQVPSLAAGATDTVYKVWTPSASGYDTMFAWTNLSNDGDHSNDSSDANFYVLAQDEYLFEDFETGFPPNEWQNVAVNGGYTWQWATSTAHPSGHNPYSGSHMAKYDSYTASSGCEARLITDTIDLSSVSTAKLEFYMFHDAGYSDKPDSLIIEIKRRSGGSWPSDWTRLGGFARYDASGDAWHEHLIEFTAGDSVIIAFRAKSGYGNDIYLDRVRLYKPPDNDVGVTEIIAKNYYQTGNTDTLWFVVKNFGAQDQSNFYVIFQGKLNTTKDSVQVSSLSVGAVDTVYKLWTPSSGGHDTITAWTNLSNDQNHDNDTTQSEVQIWYPNMHIIESFEDQFLPQDWAQDSGGNGIHWQRADRTNYPYGTYPPDGNYLVYFESHSYGSGAWARLITDTIDMTNDSAATVRFQMFHDYNEPDSNDMLVIEVKKRTGGSWPSSWTEVDTIYRYSSSKHWGEHTVDISQYTGDSVIVSFKGVSRYGTDVHIDKVEIFQNPEKEVGVQEIVGNLYQQGTQDSIGFVVKNYGSRTQADVWVFYEIKTAKTIDSVKIDTLHIRSVDTVYASWTPASAGYDSVIAWTKLTGDTVTTNDTAKKIVQVTELGVLLSEGFEYSFPPNGWENVAVIGNSTWDKTNRTNSPNGYNPHSGSYMARFMTSIEGNSARLITPEIDLTTDTLAVLEFWFFKYSAWWANPDSLIIEIKRYDPSSGWPTDWTVLKRIFRYERHTGWKRYRIPLRDYAGSKVKIAFRAIYGDGSDIHIDDVKVFVPSYRDVLVQEFIDQPAFIKNQQDTLRFIISNVGSMDATDFYLHYRFNSSNAKGHESSVHIDSLPAGKTDTIKVAWTPTASYFDTLTIWTALSGDTVYSNDTLIVYDVNILDEDQRVREDFERPDHGFPQLGWYATDRWDLYVSGANGMAQASLYGDDDTLSTYQFHLPSGTTYRLKFDFSQLPSSYDTVKIFADTTELGEIPDGSHKGEWQKAYYNLNSFADQDVKIHWVYLSSDQNDGHSFYLDNVYVEEAPTYDPVVIYVVSPTSADTVPAGTTLTFKGKFANFGTGSATFKAKVEVNEPTSGKSAKGTTFTDSSNITVSSWDTTDLTFPNTWSVPQWNYYNTLENYEIQMSTEMSSDGDNSNNEYRDTVFVIAHEVHTVDSPRWVLKDTLRGATFNWVELTTMNTDSVDTFALGDEGDTVITLGRPIKINGTLYDSVRIGANGGIEFSPNESNISYSNGHLYTTRQSVFFAVFWEDLDVSSDLSGAPNKLVYARVWDDSTVIEWYNVTRRGRNETFTFEIIIYTPDGGKGNIKFQYNGMGNYSSDNLDATIGFQVDHHAVNAAEYTYNEEPYTPNWDHWAILCENPENSPASKDIGVYSISNLVSPHVGDTDTITVTVKNYGTEKAYNFWVYLKIDSMYFDSVYVTDTLQPSTKGSTKGVKFTDVYMTAEAGGYLHQTQAWIKYTGDLVSDNDSATSDRFYVYKGDYWSSFEDSPDYPYVPGWTAYDYAGGGSWEHVQSGGFDGISAMQIYNDPYASIPEYGGYDDWLFPPPIDVRPDADDYFNFMARTMGASQDSIEILIDSSGGSTVLKANFYHYTTVIVENEWKLYKIDLDQFDGKVVKVALRYRKGYFEEGGVLIDGIDISKVRDILAPQIHAEKLPYNHYYNNKKDSIKVKLRDRSGVNSSSVKVHYRTKPDGGSWSDWQIIQMAAQGNQEYYTALGPFQAGTDVEYKIERADSAGNSAITDSLLYRVHSLADKYREIKVLTNNTPHAHDFFYGAAIAFGSGAGTGELLDGTTVGEGMKLAFFLLGTQQGLGEKLLDSLNNHQKIIVSVYLKATEYHLQHGDYDKAVKYLNKTLKALQKLRYGTDDEKGYNRRKMILLTAMDWAEVFKDSSDFIERWHLKYVKSDLSESQDLKDTLQGISGDPITNGMPDIVVENTESPDMLVPWGYECVTASGDTVVVDSGWRFMTVKNGDSTNTAGGIAYVGVTYSVYFIPFNFGKFEDTTLIDTLFNRIVAFDSTASPPNLIDWCRIDPVHRDTVAPGETTDWLYVDVFEDGITNAKTDNRDSIVVEVGFGPKNSVPWLNKNWRWFRTYFDTTVDSMYRYKGKITVPNDLEPAHYDFAFRISVRDSGEYEAFYYADTIGHEDSAEVYTYDSTKAGDLWVAYENDMQCDSLKNFEDGDTVAGGSSKTPSIFLSNRGRNSASFKAFCYIINTTTGDTVYRDSLSYSNIPPDSSFWADFSTWNAPTFLQNKPMADFKIVTFAKLTGDNHTSNDTVTRTFKVLTHEIHDNMGWVAKDVDGGASYNWVELVSNKVDSVDTLAPGDDGEAWVKLGRHTVIYGDTIDSVYVGSNGAIRLIGQDIGYSNQALPVSGPVLIAPFWDDLYVKSSVTGGPDSLIYVRVWPDSTVIEWYRVAVYGSNRLFTFEVIIYTPAAPGHGNIKFQYKDMSAYDPESDDATIGIQDSSGNKATGNYILYTHNENPFTPNWSAGKLSGLRKFATTPDGLEPVAGLMGEGGVPKSGQAILFINPQPTGIEEGDGGLSLPNVLTLYPNTPNPFMKSTVIRYAVPRPMDIELAVYDVSGRMVSLIKSGRHEPGIYTISWHGEGNSGRKLPAGVYFLKLEGEDKLLIRKIVLLK